MANEQGFSHIKVRASEPADEVIYAGASAQPAQDEQQEQSKPPVQSEKNEQQVKVEKPAQPMKAKRKTSNDDTYHETTLEDLKGVKAPLAQKLVIIAAIVLIIVAIVYYFVALR